MLSARLRYQPIARSDLDAFHGLVQDGHVRRYLLDGDIVPRDWSEQRIRDSQALFERRGVGIWLAHDRASGDLVGFCGFVELPAVHPEPQLVYAMLERFAGRGYATEMARASIAVARGHPGFDAIFTGVDAVNGASIRVLEKLGFEPISTQPGAFGEVLLFRLDGDCR